MVEAYHCEPPWAVGMALAFKLDAMAWSVLPSARCRLMALTSGTGSTHLLGAMPVHDYARYPPLRSRDL
jgi:hypothetical protein